MAPCHAPILIYVPLTPAPPPNNPPPQHSNATRAPLPLDSYNNPLSPPLPYQRARGVIGLLGGEEAGDDRVGARHLHLQLNFHLN